MRYRPQGFTRAVCPYYLTDSRLTISCECPCAERFRLEFRSPQEKAAYMHSQCFRFSSACPWRQAMDKIENEKE